jgi:predicted nucleotidyltransferase
MRLTAEQAQLIKKNCQEVFGAGSTVYLFGSRTQDELKGGDIDLYVIAENAASLKSKLELSAKLQLELGEQKIDIIIASDPSRLIEQEALKTGIKL